MNRNFLGLAAAAALLLAPGIAAAAETAAERVARIFANPALPQASPETIAPLLAPIVVMRQRASAGAPLFQSSGASPYVRGAEAKFAGPRMLLRIELTPDTNINLDMLATELEQRLGRPIQRGLALRRWHPKAGLEMSLRTDSASDNGDPVLVLELRRDET